MKISSKKLATFAMSNEMKIGSDPSEIFMPYGRWAYGRKSVELPDGITKTVFVMQSFNKPGATKIALALEAAVAAGGKGIPLYFGHPDVPEVAHKFPDKRAKGWARAAVAEEKGLRFSDITWNESPADGFGWFSPYWSGEAHWTDEQNAESSIDELSSIGLTNNPNILDFRLANEAGYEETNNSGDAADKKKGTTMELEQIKKALNLPAEATLEQVLAEITKMMTDKDDDETKIDAANAETEAAKAEADKNKVALENERKLRVDLILANAIADGRISVAASPAWKKRLMGNINAGSIALANEKPLKTKSDTSDLDPARNASAPDVGALANEMIAKGMTFNDAWAKLKKTRPELFVTAAK